MDGDHLRDQLWLVEKMIAEATAAIDTVREQVSRLWPGSEQHQRMHQLLIGLERHSADLRLLRIVLQVRRDRPETGERLKR
jgi:hypothetical protein